MNKISWKDVFNCQKVFPESFYKCQEIAKSVGYKYMVFNGLVFSVNAKSPEDYLCRDSDLIV